MREIDEYTNEPASPLNNNHSPAKASADDFRKLLESNSKNSKKNSPLPAEATGSKNGFNYTVPDTRVRVHASRVFVFIDNLSPVVSRAKERQPGPRVFSLKKQLLNALKSFKKQLSNSPPDTATEGVFIF